MMIEKMEKKTLSKFLNPFFSYLLELIKIDVFFIFLKNALSHMPWVSGVSEQETTMKSLSDASVSSGTVKPRGNRFRH